MTPPPGPYSGASALALVARASAFSFGLVYGSVKLKILKCSLPVGIAGLVLSSVTLHAPPKIRTSSVMVLFVHRLYFLVSSLPGDRVEKLDQTSPSLAALEIPMLIAVSFPLHNLGSAIRVKSLRWSRPEDESYLHSNCNDSKSNEINWGDMSFYDKKYTNTSALLLGEETQSGCDVLDHGHGIIKFLYRGCFVDRDKPLGESIPAFDFHTWRAQITQWKRNLFTDQPPSFP
ncbi:hypothetical protein POTOM_020069 [Populus tomentosa]|uniref:Uncharacterized protein n=1 Tax=Populus tomentosa TaxID=118781 RepID=A0A8X7ZVN0_POPTO|nr:hypothetical protein POTOM_020069 [Populus tomentosa]